MAKKESTQHKLDRVRAPRVQLTYDVEVGDAIEKKELPFVAGVVGNFTGQPAEPLAKLKDRKFVNVDKDNVIRNAVSSGTMWRGLEVILKGRDPRDAWAFVQRICGVCTGTPGETLVVLRLPFGSFTPDQTPSDVLVNLDLSDFADLGQCQRVRHGRAAVGASRALGHADENCQFGARFFGHTRRSD